MNEINNNNLLRQLFKELLQDLKSDRNYDLAYNSLSQLIQLSISHEQFSSKNNDKLGLISIQNNNPEGKKGLRQLLKKYENSQDHTMQRIFVTKVFKSKYAPSNDQQREILEDLYDGLVNSNREEQSYLLVHYKNNFHLIQDPKKDKIKLQKNLIISSPVLDLTNYDRISIEPYDYFFKRFPQQKYQYLAQPNSKILNVRNLNYRSINGLKEQLLNDYKRIVDFKQKTWKDNIERLKSLYRLHCLIKTKLQQASCSWHAKSDYRICVLSQPKNGFKKREDLQSNLFIYKKFETCYADKDSSFFEVTLKQDDGFVQNNKESAELIEELRIIKQLMLYRLIHKKNKAATERIISFRETLQKGFYDNLREKQRGIQQEQKRKMDRIKQGTGLSNYQNHNIRNLFLDWKNKVNKLSATKKPFLSISFIELNLIPQFKYTDMACNVWIEYRDKRDKSQQSKPKSKVFTYSFDENTEDWCVTLTLDEKSRKNMAFQLDDVNNILQVVIDISSEQKKNEKSFKIGNQFFVSKNQKLGSFGQSYQLDLHEKNASNSKIRPVGFLNMFFLIKNHLNIDTAENFQIQNYRKIKVLENMGKIPPNFYQSISIDYSPNSIPLFASLLSHQQKNISRKNFQQIYLKLIEFLENQKMNKRRAKIMSTENLYSSQPQIRKTGLKLSTLSQNLGAKTFSPQSRADEYERILKFDVVNKIKQQYDPKYIYYFDSKGNIDSELKQRYMERKQTSKSNYNQDADLIQRFVIYEIPSVRDQISHKISALLPENLKVSIEEAYKRFCSQPHKQTLGIVSLLFSLNSSNTQQTVVSVFKSEKDGQNRVDFTKTQSSLKFLQSFNPFIIPLVNRITTIFKQKQDQNYEDTRSRTSTSSINQTTVESISLIKAAEFAINVLQNIYPYFSTVNLQRQSLCVRYFVQKYLPQLNFSLNRKNIGLQNFIAKYLLSFFTIDLEEEVTFQIWDFIMLSSNKFAARITCILTLLIFLQKSDFHPIIPLNSFANALQVNYKRFGLINSMKKITDTMVESLGKLFQKQHERKQKLFELRDQNGNLLIGNEFLKKIMFDSQRSNKVNYAGNKKVNLNNLVYKLPEPKYRGYPVKQIKILLKSFFVFQTVSINSWALVVKWHNQQSQRIILNQKSQILNQFIKFQYPKYLKENNYDLTPIQFFIYPLRNEDSTEEKFLFGFLNVINLHKDNVYNEEVRLIYSRKKQFQLSNKGENVLNVQIILKSEEKKVEMLNQSRSRTGFAESRKNDLEATVNTVNLRLEKEYFVNQQNRLQMLYDRLLDYNISEQANDAIKEVANMKILFNKMKNPIDQFTQQKYERLKVPIVGDGTFPQVLMNSELLIQHFQALISQTFPNSVEMQTKLPELYKIFSKQTNYQMVFLTEILIESVLLDNSICLQQKIEYLYCLGKHYQNCGGTGLTTQTVDYVFSQIYKTYGWLNSVPYSAEGKGKIISGIIYVKGVKNQQDGLDITNILRDWAHLCKIKFGNLGLFLGDATYLTQLRLLLPNQTLEYLQRQSENVDIRIEINYEKNSSLYVWSATVTAEDFKVKKSGIKFLQRYPNSQELHSGKVIEHDEGCNSLKNAPFGRSQCSSKCRTIDLQLDTSSQILYNCSNFISLQSRNPIDLEAFRNCIYSTPLLCYLLNYSSVYEPTKISWDKSHVSRISKSAQRPEQSQYTDWILYRYQNSMQKWRPCCLNEIVDSNCQVSFPEKSLQVERQTRQLLQVHYNYVISDQIICKAPSFQVWSMAQNLVNSQETNYCPKLRDNLKNNQKEALTKIYSQTKPKKW